MDSLARLIAAGVVLLTLSGCWDPSPDRRPRHAVIAAVHCTEETGAPDCYTALRFDDGTILRRGGVYGAVGDSVVAWPCPSNPTVWCSYPYRGPGPEEDTRG